MIPLIAFLIPITAHHTQSHLLTSLVPRLNNKVQQRLVVTANMALQDMVLTAHYYSQLMAQHASLIYSFMLAAC